MVVKWQERIPAAYIRSTQVLAWIAATIILALMLLISYDVITRYVIGRASGWVTGLSFEILMVCVTFLPAAWILLLGGHVSVRLLVERFSPRWQRIVTRSTDVLALVYSVVLTWHVWLLMWSAFVSGHLLTATTLTVPKWPAYAIVFVGGVFLCIGFIMRVAGEFWFPSYDLGRPEEQSEEL